MTNVFTQRYSKLQKKTPLYRHNGTPKIDVYTHQYANAYLSTPLSLQTSTPKQIPP